MTYNKSKNPMEEIWDQVAQTDKDGQKYIRYKGQYDLIFLYANGFVDFRKFPLEEWIGAFADSREPDESYKVTRDQWMAKARFRYSGPVGDPFDPQTLKEREFSEDEFRDIFKQFICPATWIPEGSIPQILDYYRKKGRLVGGKIKMDPELKKDFQEVLEKLPSPLRVLQLDVANIRYRKGFPMPATTPATGYVAGQDAQKTAAARLKQLTEPAQGQPAATGGETVSLKDLKKKKKTQGPA